MSKQAKTSVSVPVNGEIVKLSRHSQGGYRKFIWGRMWMLGKDAAKAASLAVAIEMAAEQEQVSGNVEWSETASEAILDLIRAVNGDQHARRMILAIDAMGRVDRPESKSFLEWIETTSTPAIAVPTRSTSAPIAALSSGPANMQATTTDCLLSDAIATWTATIKDSSRADSNKESLENHIKGLKLTDCKLTEFGYDALLQLVDDQIKATKQGTLSPFTVSNRIGALRQFVKWLGKTDKYAWHGFPDIGEFFSEQLQKISGLKRARIKAKKAESRINLDILIKLYATTETLPVTRACLLLALNCGMLNTEISTLMPAHLKLSSEHPYIDRCRNKTQVSAHWFLWSETAKAIGACQQTNDKDKPVFLTANGLPLLHGVTDNVGQRWTLLLKQAGLKGTGYAFEYLRKFAAQWIRTNGGAEYYKAFLAHEESGVEANYTTFQDYDGLGKAIMDFRAYLAPMFGEKPDGQQQGKTRKKNKKPAASPAAGSAAG